MRTKACAWGAALLVLHSLVSPVYALPSGGSVVPGSGAATIETVGSDMTVRQTTERVVIDWTTFDIGAGESVTFNQPGADAVALNRVLGVSGSQIDGMLSANGQVFIVNPNGIIFGPGARVNVGGLVASTLSLDVDTFLNGEYRFSGLGGGVENFGEIVAKPGGYVALVGGQVTNEGAISAKGGAVSLAAGDSVNLVLGAEGRITAKVEAGAAGAKVENRAGAEIVADGGIVLLTAKEANAVLDTVINNEGLARARTIVDEDGVTKLVGSVKLLGGTGGGTVMVGGTLDASAPDGGDGGRVETSGFRVIVDEDVKVKTAAPSGRPGEWLIDPTNVVIGTSDPGDASSFVPVSVLQNQLENEGSVTIETSSSDVPGHDGDIDVAADVVWNSDNALILRAHNDVVVNADISAPNAELTLRADWDADGRGTVRIGDSADVDVSASHVWIFYNPEGDGTSSKYAGSDKSDWSGSPYAGTISGPFTAYMLVNNPDDLDLIRTNLQGFYALGNDIDAAKWSEGDGFVPIGWTVDEDGDVDVDGFSGIFEGDGRAIRGLYINRPDGDYVGLFALLDDAEVRNLRLTHVSIKGREKVGGLAGSSWSSNIENVHVSGSISGVTDVGGLLGYSTESKIHGGSATNIKVTGFEHVGGLIGTSQYDYHVANVSVKGEVSGKGAASGEDGESPSWAVGGVFGWAMESWIEGASFQGTVTGDDGVGGLVGVSGFWIEVLGSQIMQSWADALVEGRWSVGGLVGLGDYSTSLVEVFSDGLVRGEEGVGGLVGYLAVGTIHDAYSTAAVHGIDAVGGLVGGLYESNISRAYSTGAVTSDENATAVGGVIGLISESSQVQLSNVYWNTQTSGQDQAVGMVESSDRIDDIMEEVNSVQGLTTSQLQSGLPEGFEPIGGEIEPVWGIIPNTSYPYFTWRFPIGPSVISGWVYNEDRSEEVGYLVGGMALGGNVSGPRHSGADGYYYSMFDPEQDAPLIIWFGGDKAENTKGDRVEYRGNALQFISGRHATDTWVRDGWITVTNPGSTLSGILGGAVSGIEDVNNHSGILYSLGSYDVDEDVHISIEAPNDFVINEKLTAKGSGKVIVTTTVPPEDDDGYSVTVAAPVIAEQGTVTILASKDVIIANSGSITSQAAGNSIVISATKAFHNAAGPEALSAPNGRWLVYSENPEANEFGGLDSGNTAIWNATYESLSPDEVTQEGNYYLFAHQPTLVVSAGDLEKTYGDEIDQDTLNRTFKVTGYHPGVPGAFLGDSAETSFTGEPEILSDGAPATASVSGSPYEIRIVNTGTLTPLNGYRIEPDPTPGKLTVKPREVTIINLAAKGKTYDGKKDAQLDWTYAGLQGVLAEDLPFVAFVQEAFKGEFEDANAGKGKTVIVTLVDPEESTGLAGERAGNYVLKLADPWTLTADIDPRELAIAGLKAQSKVYDGKKTATLDWSEAQLVGVDPDLGVLPEDADKVWADESAFQGEFEDANAGKGKTVIVTLVSPDGSTGLGGERAGNYVLKLADPWTLTADIDPRELAIQGLKALSKVYDGMKAAELDWSEAQLVGIDPDLGVLPEDADKVWVDESAFQGEFEDANAGKGKTVIVTLVDPAESTGLGGERAGNYVLRLADPWTLTADIDPRELTIEGLKALSKVYDGTKTAALDWTTAGLQGVLPGDLRFVAVVEEAFKGEFEDANAGKAKTVTVTLADPSESTGLAGERAGNYVLKLPLTLTADIDPRELTIAGLKALSKVYDGTKSAELDWRDAQPVGVDPSLGVLSGDDVELEFSNYTAEFADKNAGEDIPVSVAGIRLVGAQASNYTLIMPDNLKADINPATLVVRVSSAFRFVGADNPPFSAEYIGFVPGEDVSVLSGELKLSTPATPSSPPGTYPITAEGSTLTARNYQIVYEPGNLVVLPLEPGSEPFVGCGGVVNRVYEEGEALRMSVSIYCGSHAFPIPIQLEVTDPAVAALLRQLGVLPSEL